MTTAAITLFSKLVSAFEGDVLVGYLDEGGVPTIGKGHTGPEVYVGLVWEQYQSDAAFEADSQNAVTFVQNQSPCILNYSPGTQAAAYDMAYNCGVGAYRSSTFRKNLEAGDFDAAKKSILLWDKAHIDGHLVEVPGLLRRRQAEADLIGT